MKLRVRSVETKETLKIEIPEPSSLDHLKTLIAGRIPSPVPSPATLRLSLNRRDELAAPPGATLHSLGLTSGDLVFYTLDPAAFSSSSSSPPSQTPNVAAPFQSAVEEIRPPPESMGETLTPASSILPAGEGSRHPSEPVDEPLTLDGSTRGGLTGNEQRGAPVLPEAAMDDTLMAPVDGMEVDSETTAQSIPGFLKRVLELEMGNAKGDLGILVIAVHAVFVESGFVAYKCDGSRMPDGWASKAATVSISYTIPELVKPEFHAVVETVELKFMLIGKFVDVYGSLSRSSDLHRLCLDVLKFVPSVVSSVASMDEKDEKVLFELWKMVKDMLALPLLIDICEKNGLSPPPCFTCLPMELKVRVLEFLPGVHLAKVGCVSSELRYLSSNDELWKQKVLDEFPGYELYNLIGRRWKDKYVFVWEEKKNKRYRSASRFGIPLFRRGPAPFGRPWFNVIGGDYDRFPAIGGGGPSRRTFVPHCNLGGFSG